MGTNNITGVARIHAHGSKIRAMLAFPESRFGALTIMLNANNCNGENRTLITRVSDGLPTIERHYSAVPGTRTRTSLKRDYSQFSKLLPYQLGLKPQM